MAIDDPKTRTKDEKPVAEKPAIEGEVTMASVLARLVDIQAANQEVQKAQLKQTAPKSNTRAPMISAFNPRGEKDFPMPALKCEIFAPWQSKPGLHGLDREEVELFNLLEPGVYPVDLNDGSTVTVNVVGVKNSITGKIERLSLLGLRDDETGQYGALFTKENKQYFPAMRLMLRQMLGETAEAVMPIAEERRRVALPAEHPKHLSVSVGA